MVGPPRTPLAPNRPPSGPTPASTAGAAPPGAPVRAATANSAAAAPPPASSPQPPKMNPFRTWWPYAALAIPVSSLLGLLILIFSKGVEAFGALWSANLWGDLVFAAGTFGAFWVSATVASAEGRPTGARFAAAAGVGFIAHLAVYLVAAWLSFEAPSFLSLHLAAAGSDDALLLLRYGLVGLGGMAFAGPLVGLFLPQAPSPAAKEQK